MPGTGGDGWGGYERLWVLCLGSCSSSPAFTCRNVIVCGRKSGTVPASADHGVPAASSAAYLMFRNVLLELGSLSKPWLLAAETLKLLFFASCLP